jgi:uncharacterized membrane protein YbhN (UPF0104 family)
MFSTTAAATAPAAAGRRTGAFVLAYVLAAALLLGLLHAGGVWSVLANTRALDLLVRSGIVALTDADAGWVVGVPDLEQYLASQDPVDWGMLALASGVFCLYWAVKSLQFHLVSRFCGVEGEVGEHARAYLYGLGVSRMLPFDLGEVATADALEAGGAEPPRAARAVFLTHLLVVLEIVVFAAIGLVLVGLGGWFAMLFWGVVILGVAWYLVRPGRAGRGRYLTAVRRSVRAVASQPGFGARVVLLSLVAFLLEDVAAYVITQAFTSENVILNVDNKVLVMGLVAGYAARLICVTPGGIGQFEWAFAAALYAGGVGFPEAVTIAVLDNLVRYVTGTGVMLAMTVRYGSGTTLRRVLRRSTRTSEVAS